MITVTQISQYLLIASIVLFGSGIIDIWLWFNYGYQVPSWAIGVMSLGVGVLLLFFSSNLAQILLDAQELAQRLEDKILRRHKEVGQKLQQTNQH